MNIDTTRLYFTDYAPLNFQFVQNRYDFIVDEIPYKDFGSHGNFLILHIQKEYLSTWDLLKHISKVLNIEEHKIGYAGLKDKHATTTQYISIPLMKEKQLERLNNKYIKILAVYKDTKKLNIGDLKGNKFTITLKQIDENDLPNIYKTISHIQKFGMLNYFGYQRFGKEYSFDKAKDVVYGDKIIKNNKNLEHLMGAAYQSYFFNGWLKKRVQLSIDANSKKLKTLDGDVFSLNDKSTITGLLPGRKIIRAKSQAREIEQQYDDQYIHIKGFRRDAVVKVKNLTNKYYSENQTLTLHFELPKSSYATVLIETLANKNFK